MVPRPFPPKAARVGALLVVATLLAGCTGSDDVAPQPTGPSAADLGQEKPTPTGSGASTPPPARPPPPPRPDNYSHSDGGSATPNLVANHEWTVEPNWTRIYITFHVTGTPAVAAIRPDVFVSSNGDEVCDAGTPAQVSTTKVVMMMFEAIRVKQDVDTSSVGQCTDVPLPGQWVFQGSAAAVTGNWELIIETQY